MTSRAQAIGGAAEEEAARYLSRCGLEVVARNFRTRLGEIDLIARDGEVLVFVEVRLRSSVRFGDAMESIDAHKRRRIVAAARQFLSGVRPEPPCRFDVVALDEGAPRWERAAFDAA